jgi:small subunit ribosomal protein S17
MKNKEEKKRRINVVLTGEVVSVKADKTISVSVQRTFKHSIYKKIVRRKKKYLAHDENNKCSLGDIVKIKLVRPISKRKKWMLLDVISTTPDKEVIK